MTTRDAHIETPTKPRRRWYQFSLRALLVGVAVVGFGTAWLGEQVKRALDQRRAVTALAAVADVEFAKPRTWVQRNAWLRSWLGEEAIQDVDSVSFRPATKEEKLESALAQLDKLTNLQSLVLSVTQVNDTGLTQLQHLYLGGTQVGDAGLPHLGRLKQLRFIDLSQTQVSDAGVARLQESLPKLAVKR